MNAALRRDLKKLYKFKRQEDGREVGRKKNKLSQFLMSCAKLEVDPKSDEVQQAYSELVEMGKEKRFRHEFPTFARFRKYLREEEVSLKDLCEWWEIPNPNQKVEEKVEA